MRKLLLTLVVAVAFFTITTDVGDVSFSRDSNISRNLHYLDIKTPLSSFTLGTGNLFQPKDEDKTEKPNVPGGQNAPVVSANDNQEVRKAVVEYVYAQIGKGYSWGATGPNRFDCSGLLYAAYKSQGIIIPRTTFLMRNNLQVVPAEQAQPGDFFLVQGHVGMYVGNGKIVEAAGQQHTGEVKENVVTNKWWQARNPVFVNPFKLK